MGDGPSPVEISLDLSPSSPRWLTVWSSASSTRCTVGGAVVASAAGAHTLRRRQLDAAGAALKRAAESDRRVALPWP